MCYIPLRPHLMESGVVQQVQVGFGAHHDVPHFRELVVEQGFGVHIRDVLVGVDFEDMNASQLGVDP